jgi:hypothetical protein
MSILLNASSFSSSSPLHQTDVQDLTAATEIARSDAMRGPALSSIQDVLLKHNIRVPSKTVDMNGADNVREAKEWLAEQTEVVILHHDYVAAPRVSRRASSDYTNSTGLTEEEINDYQVREGSFYCPLPSLF